RRLRGRYPRSDRFASESHGLHQPACPQVRRTGASYRSREACLKRPRHYRVERGNLEKEAVMAEGRRQLDEARRRADALQSLDDAARFGGGVEPVGVEAYQGETYIFSTRKGVRELAIMRFCEVEIIHRAGDVEIGVCVKAIGKCEPLMSEIGFDLEIRVEAEALRIAGLQAATEFLGQPRFGQIGDMRRHPRDSEALRRPS